MPPNPKPCSLKPKPLCGSCVHTSAQFQTSQSTLLGMQWSSDLHTRYAHTPPAHGDRLFRCPPFRTRSPGVRGQRGGCAISTGWRELREPTKRHPAQPSGFDGGGQGRRRWAAALGRACLRTQTLGRMAAGRGLPANPGDMLSRSWLTISTRVALCIGRGTARFPETKGGVGSASGGGEHQGPYSRAGPQ